MFIIIIIVIISIIIIVITAADAKRRSPRGGAWRHLPTIYLPRATRIYLPTYY